MFFLQKIFQFRDHANPTAEKPFLEHLEDLRVCITRITIALLIATVGCFIFRNDLMEVMRRPVEQVWVMTQEEALSKAKVGVDLDTWEAAKKAASNVTGLSDKERAVYYEKISGGTDEFDFHVRAFRYYAAALSMEDKTLRTAFLNDLEIEDELREQVFTLLDGQPESAVDARARLVLMQSLKPAEAFMLSIKLAFFAGIVIAFPFLLYFLLQFVLPGMHEKEQRALFPALMIGFGLFIGGVMFAYFIVLPRVLEFFHSYASDMTIQNEWRIGYYISFTTQVTLIFGLAFELPVVVMTLVKIGILEYDMMKRTRAYAVLAIFIIAALITPTPDAFTLCLLALPMVILYEICIWLAYLLDRKDKEREAEEERERMERLLASPAAATKPAGDDESDTLETEAPGESGLPAHYEDDPYHGDDYDFDADHEDLDTHEESDPGEENEDENKKE